MCFAPVNWWGRPSPTWWAEGGRGHISQIENEKVTTFTEMSGSVFLLSQTPKKPIKSGFFSCLSGGCVFIFFRPYSLFN